MQAQISVLNRQVATWADVGEDVKRERHRMLLEFEERRKWQQRCMSDLYNNMKIQTTKYLQIVVANMCYRRSVTCTKSPRKTVRGQLRI